MTHRRSRRQRLKDLLVNFTGLEWCPWCRVLYDKILVRDEFAPAANDFVLVDLDFPVDHDDLGPLKDSYNGWVRKYLIRGYPTIVLADERWSAVRVSDWRRRCRRSKRHKFFVFARQNA